MTRLPVKAEASWTRPALGRVIVWAIVGLELAWIAFTFVASLSSPSFGLDFTWHLDAGWRLLEEGTLYWPWQISGPYVIGNGAILYPPVAFALFIPFLWPPRSCGGSCESLLRPTQ